MRRGRAATRVHRTSRRHVHMAAHRATAAAERMSTSIENAHRMRGTRVPQALYFNWTGPTGPTLQQNTNPHL
ncbi:unnamed protein product [Sphagnum balticum]